MQQKNPEELWLREWQHVAWAGFTWQLDWSWERRYKREALIGVRSPCFQVASTPRWRWLLSSYFAWPCSTRDSAVRDFSALLSSSLPALNLYYSHVTQNTCTAVWLRSCCFPDTLDSCVGRCGYGTDLTYTCQCNPPCELYGDCCSDYATECKGKCSSVAEPPKHFFFIYIKLKILICTERAFLSFSSRCSLVL